jgi:hypothetical protein
MRPWGSQLGHRPVLSKPKQTTAIAVGFGVLHVESSSVTSGHKKSGDRKISLGQLMRVREEEQRNVK